MQTIWDLLAASLWPTQPFIPPGQQAQVIPARWAMQTPASALSAAIGGAGNFAGAPAWQGPNPLPIASGGDDASTTGGILGPIFGSSVGVPPATSFPNLPQLPQAAPFAPVASTVNQLDPSSPPAAAPPAPQASIASNVTPPITAPANQVGGALGAAASGLTPAQQEAALARSMLPRPPSPEDPYGRAPPEGWLMRQLEWLDPPLASSIRNGSVWEPITAPAQSILPNIRQAAKDSAQLFRDGAYEAIHGNTFTGPARMALGTLGFLGSPLTGAGTTLGDEATKWTGNPDFGRKAELLAPLLISTAAGALARSVGPRASARVPPTAPSALAGTAQYSSDQANLIRNWLGIDPQRFSGTVTLDPPSVKGWLLDQSGARMGQIESAISPKTGVAYHGFFDLKEPYQNLGIGTDINRARIAYYRQLGLSRVGLQASLDRGGYAWARSGFLPTQESWNALRPVLRDKILDPSLELTPIKRQQMLDHLSSRDPRAIWNIADDRTPVVIDGKSVMLGDQPLPLGNHLLSDTDWAGNLDLNDADAMDRFDKYVGPKK